MTALPKDVAADLRRRVAELEQKLQSGLAERDEAIAQQAATALENARLLNELRAGLDRQTASAEILRTIASAPGDAERALQQIAETTARLFGGQSVRIRIVENDQWSRTISVGASAKRIDAELSAAQMRIGARNLPGTGVARKPADPYSRPRQCRSRDRRLARSAACARGGHPHDGRHARCDARVRRSALSSCTAAGSLPSPPTSLRSCRASPTRR